MSAGLLYDPMYEALEMGKLQGVREQSSGYRAAERDGAAGGRRAFGGVMDLFFLLVSLGYGGGYTALSIYLNLYKDVLRKGEILLNLNGKEN